MKWSAPMGRSAVYITIGLLAPSMIFFLAFYLVNRDPTWLIGMLLVVGAGFGTIIVFRTAKLPHQQYSRKPYDGDTKDIVERIDGALVEAGIPFERMGPSGSEMGPSTLETFKIEDDDLSVEIISRGVGVVVLIGPMNEFNMTAVERYQGIIDSAADQDYDFWGR